MPRKEVGKPAKSHSPSTRDRLIDLAHHRSGHMSQSERKEEHIGSDALFVEVFGADDAPQDIGNDGTHNYIEDVFHQKESVNTADLEISEERQEDSADLFEYDNLQDTQQDDSKEDLGKNEEEYLLQNLHAQSIDVAEIDTNNGAERQTVVQSEDVYAEVFNALQDSPSGIRDYVGSAFPNADGDPMLLSSGSAAANSPDIVGSQEVIVSDNDEEVLSMNEKSTSELRNGNGNHIVADVQVMDSNENIRNAKDHVQSEDLFAEVFGHDMAPKDDSGHDYIQSAFSPQNVSDPQSATTTDAKGAPQIMDLINFDDH